METALAGLRPALRGWKLVSLAVAGSDLCQSPTRLEGMETRKSPRTSHHPLRSPTRLEGMETADAEYHPPKCQLSPTRLEGMETLVSSLIPENFRLSPTRLEGMETKTVVGFGFRLRRVSDPP